MIDLGAWASESYRIPVMETDESDDVPPDDAGDTGTGPN